MYSLSALFSRCRLHLSSSLSVSLSLSFISQLEAWWETSALELWWSTFLVPSLCAGITLSHSPWTSSGDITVVVSLTVWGAGLNAVGSLFVRLWVRCWISSCYVRNLTMEEGEAFTSTQAAHASSLLAFGMDRNVNFFHFTIMSLTVPK